jgi:putative tricarboxylic transport membrane protein
MMKTIPTTLAAVALLALAGAPAHAWEPSAPVELVVPAGTGGGADQMARFVAQMVTKHKLMSQPLTVVNKAGNSGIEGLLDVKAAKGNPHKLIITLSNLFTTPLATGTDFTWRDITPVQMLALDQFVLWVNADSPYKSAKELVDAMRRHRPAASSSAAPAASRKTSSSACCWKPLRRRGCRTMPLKGGGDVARALAAKEVDLTVNNPIEAAKLWRRGQGAAAVRVRRPASLAYPARITATQAGRLAHLHVLRHPGSIPDDARHLHGARRRAGPGGLLQPAPRPRACAA